MAAPHLDCIVEALVEASPAVEVKWFPGQRVGEPPTRHLQVPTYRCSRSHSAGNLRAAVSPRHEEENIYHVLSAETLSPGAPVLREEGSVASPLYESLDETPVVHVMESDLDKEDPPTVFPLWGDSGWPPPRRSSVPCSPFLPRYQRAISEGGERRCKLTRSHSSAGSLARDADFPKNRRRTSFDQIKPDAPDVERIPSLLALRDAGGGKAEREGDYATIESLTRPTEETPTEPPRGGGRRSSCPALSGRPLTLPVEIEISGVSLTVKHKKKQECRAAGVARVKKRMSVKAVKHARPSVRDISWSKEARKVGQAHLQETETHETDAQPSLQAKESAAAAGLMPPTAETLRRESYREAVDSLAAEKLRMRLRRQRRASWAQIVDSKMAKEAAGGCSMQRFMAFLRRGFSATEPRRPSHPVLRHTASNGSGGGGGEVTMRPSSLREYSLQATGASTEAVETLSYQRLEWRNSHSSSTFADDEGETPTTMTAPIGRDTDSELGTGRPHPQLPNHVISASHTHTPYPAHRIASSLM